MDTCPICGSQKVKSFSKLSRENKNLELIQCKSCHYLGQKKRFDDIYTDGSFTEIARDGLKQPSKEKIKTLDNNAWKRYNFFGKYIKGANSILEIGSSIGAFVDVLKMAGKDADGLEPDPDYAAFSQHQYGFQQSSALLEDFKTEKTYDLCCSFHVIEHVADPEIFIKNQYNLLNENGRILIECPSLEIFSFGDMKHTIWEPHLHYFSKSSLYSLLSPYFQIEKIGYYGIAVYIVGKKRPEIVTQKKASIRIRISEVLSRTLVQASRIGKTKLKKPEAVRTLVLMGILQKGRFADLIGLFFSFAGHKIREKVQLIKEKNLFKGKKKVNHFTLFSGWGNNAGDLVLSSVVRKTLDTLSPKKWNIIKLHRKVNESMIQTMNQADINVVGGGGLFLPDTNPNSVSYWQWPISREALKAVQKPICGFAIGYNYFPGQDPSDDFVDNLNAFVDRADFLGLRNHGSISKVKALLDANQEKVDYQTCPTTIISKLYNLPKKQDGKKIAVNIAFDRYQLRFGEHKNRILRDIALSLKDLHEQGYEIYYASHLLIDRKFLVVLDALKVPYTLVNLDRKISPEIIRFYRKMDLVIGMRGHAQMIPFGTESMICTLGTHDKMKYFLEDIDALDWYVDLKSNSDIRKEIVDKVLQQFENRNVILEKNQKEQDRLWNLTQENLKKIEQLSV